MAKAKSSYKKTTVKLGSAKNSGKKETKVEKQKASKSLTDKEAAEKFSGKCPVCGK